MTNFDGRRVPIRLKDRETRHGSFPYYGASGIIDYIDDYLFDGRYLLIAEDGANLISRSTPIAFEATGKFWVNNHAHVIQSLGDFIPLNYLNRYFNFIDLTPYITGSAQPKLNQKNLNRILIPIPPLNEQRRIVSEIEKLTAHSKRAREALDDVPKLIERFKQSVLAAAFRGDLTADWREKNPDAEPAEKLLQKIRSKHRQRWEKSELDKITAKGKKLKDDSWKDKYREPVSPDISNLPKVPATWQWSTLPELGELNRGKSKHRPRNDPALYGGSFPFIQTGDVRSVDGIIYESRQTYNETGLRQSRLWPKGTLCITIAANIAETAILGIDACFPDSIVGFLADESSCDVKFVEYFMRTAQDDLERFAPSTAQKNINLETLRVVSIPLPSLKEQRVIAQKLDDYFRIIKKIETDLSLNQDQLTLLDQSILSQSFRGLLVPQDPNDEPASVLLERIRAEREKLGATKKKKRATRKKATKAKS